MENSKKNHFLFKIKEIKLDIRAFYIIGFPRETLENIQSTLKYAINALRKYDIIPQFRGRSLYHRRNYGGWWRVYVQTAVI